MVSRGRNKVGRGRNKVGRGRKGQVEVENDQVGEGRGRKCHPVPTPKSTQPRMRIKKRNRATRYAANRRCGNKVKKDQFRSPVSRISGKKSGIFLVRLVLL